MLPCLCVCLHTSVAEGFDSYSIILCMRMSLSLLHLNPIVSLSCLCLPIAQLSKQCCLLACVAFMIQLVKYDKLNLAS